MEATKLTLPVVKIIGAVIFISSLVWFLSARSTTIDSHTRDIMVLQADLRTVPTREEFTNLKSSIDKIEVAVNAIQDYLLKK